ISIPEQIIINTSFYSQTNITNKMQIDNILDSIDLIKNSSSKGNEILESNNSAAKITGKIIYNNKVDNFALSNILFFDDTEFKGDSYLINNLHKKLMNYCNTYTHLIDILNNPNSNVTYEENFKNFNLNKNQKEDLVSKISNFKIMNDKEKLNNTKLSDSKLYTLKIEINKDVQLKTDNLIFIDVYKNYIIIQFLADDNGKKIYMKGNLDET
ncbi:DUF3919 family protein, partial [Clostridium perfringens]|uniref:DUF3919 family protein n=1 Tax=Clostridium perfringens TaxID=1502 RepID=UPI0013E365FF